MICMPYCIARNPLVGYTGILTSTKKRMKIESLKQKLMYLKQNHIENMTRISLEVKIMEDKNIDKIKI